MQIGRVLGTATATIKHPSFRGERLIVVQLETADGGKKLMVKGSVPGPKDGFVEVRG